MKTNKTIRLYNIILPIWLLIWWPSYLWLGLIPANYLFDYLVTYLSMKKLGIEDCKQKAQNHSWKVCLIGFFSDFVAAAFLLAFLYLTDIILPNELGESISYGLSWKPNLFSILIILIAIAIAGVLIYLLNRWMFKKDTDLGKEQIHRIALNLAIFTAPYLFLIPSSLIYHGM
ncbi:MAG: hypothetical protein IJI44_06790 [Erysipelotrichaceae bacterium]|nr:hypothetical protein [Erysipelotrichaceae bacterium]